MNKDEARDALMDAISMALKGYPSLQRVFEDICRENAALKETLEFQQSCTMDRYFKLKKAKEVITALLPFEHVVDPYALTCDIEENKRRFHEPFRKAEQFLKEVE